MIPDVIDGRFRRIRELGRGGMGVVYLVEEQGRKEPLALKVLSAGRYSESALRHFEQEFRTLTGLDHPNLTEVHDFGRIVEPEEGRQIPYFTMQFVDGLALDSFFEAQDRDLARLFPVLAQVGQALAYLHGRGLVHRDVKPSNILVGGPAAAPRVSLMDLGLAGSARQSGDPDSVRGTVAYLSPEAAGGGPVDPRADLYALGCVIYELVTGRPPFQGTTALSVLRGHIHEKPLPPRSLNRDVPEDLDALILRLLAKDPGLRPASADRFLQLLNAVAGGELEVETPDVRRHRVLGGGFVGRERELRRLEELIEEVRGGAGRIVLLVGEAGVGKTRLLRELQVRCQLEGFDLFGPREGTEDGAVAGALRRSLNVRGPLDANIDARHGDSLAALLGDAGRASPAGPVAAEPVNLPAAVTATLRELAVRRPLGLVLDDLHDADETTYTSLRHLARELASSRESFPLLVVGSYRGDEVSRANPLFDLLAEARREGRVEELFLDPLGPEDTEALLRAKCGIEEVPATLLRRILDETHGNPLHVGELLALLAEEGHLRPGADRPIDPDALARLELPGKIRDLLERRLARVGEQPLRVLQAAAVLDRRVLDPEAIASVTGMRWEHVVRQLMELAQSNLVVREHDDEGAPVYRIYHPGLMALAGERAEAEQTRRLHAGAASYLERRGIARAHTAWADFARHAEAAGRPGRAIEAYTRAGDLARELHANREAITLFGRAIDLCLTEGAVSATVLCGLYHKRGDARALTGDLDRAEEDYRWMLARAEKGGDPVSKARAHVALAHVLAVRSQHDEALDDLEVALEIAERGADRALEVEVRIALGEAATKLGRFDDGLEQFALARERAREAGRADLDLRALVGEGALLRDRGDYLRSLERFEEAERLADERTPAALQEAIEQGAALALEVRGEYGRAADGYSRARERARERGDARSVASLGNRLGRLRMRMGDSASAGRELEQALEMNRQLGAREGIVESLHALAQLHASTGRFETARESAGDAVELARRIGNRELVATSLNLLGSVEMRSGDLPTASAHLEEAREAIGEVRNESFLATILRDLGDLRRLQGRPDEARRHYQESAFLARRVGDPRLESRALCRLGESHLEDNDFDRALVACRKSLRVVEGSGLTREQAGARTLRARIELERPGGDVVSAEIDALESLKFFREASEPEGVWQAEHLAGRAELRLARADEASERIGRAHRYLENLRARLPETLRERFLEDPGRAAVYEDWSRLHPRVDRSTRTASAPAAIDTGELERARAEIEALKRLLEINRSLSSASDSEALLQSILDAALELTGAERGFLLLREDDQVTTRQARAAGGESIEGDALALSQSIARRTMDGGEPLLSTDAEADARFSGFESVHELQIRSVLAVPLPAGEGLAGAIYLDSRVGRKLFDSFHLELVSRLADQAALALRSARMMAQIEEQRAGLDRLNRELEKTLAAQRDALADAREALSVSRTSLEIRYRFEDLVGASPPMQEVYHLIERLAPKKIPVLVTGQSGTGKELIARALHAKSDRSGGAFFTVNCAAVSETLLESELFGYRKGAFTGADRDKPGFFELAHGGTLFLDESGEMGQAMQAKLLGAIERGEVLPVGGKSVVRVDVRVIAATHRDLTAMIRDGAFREDLYYRINVGRIHVPELRERREDIPLLVDHFLSLLAEEEKTDRKDIEPQALRLLVEHDWPGNVRELHHQIVRICAFSRGPLIRAAEVRRYGDFAATSRPGRVPAGTGATLETLEELERRQIALALETAEGNKTRAAELLGINRATLFRKLKRFDL